jgi:hypothetical protein
MLLSLTQHYWWKKSKNLFVLVVLAPSMSMMLLKTIWSLRDTRSIRKSLMTQILEKYGEVSGPRNGCVVYTLSRLLSFERLLKAIVKLLQFLTILILLWRPVQKWSFPVWRSYFNQVIYTSYNQNTSACFLYISHPSFVTFSLYILIGENKNFSLLLFFLCSLDVSHSRTL